MFLKFVKNTKKINVSVMGDSLDYFCILFFFVYICHLLFSINIVEDSCHFF